MEIATYDLRLNEDKTLKLVKENSIEYRGNNEMFTEPEKIAKMMKNIFDMDNLATEHLYVIAMNCKCKILGIFELSSGCMAETMCGIRELFQRLLMVGAVQFVVTHNHCSGYVEPSEADNRMTARIRQAASLMGIELVDHIIIGTQGYYSMKEKGGI